MLSRKLENNVLRSKSTDCQVKVGIPQGSVLGPILLIIYPNGLLKLYKGYILTFDDNTTIIC